LRQRLAACPDSKDYFCCRQQAARRKFGQNSFLREAQHITSSQDNDDVLRVKRRNLFLLQNESAVTTAF